MIEISSFLIPFTAFIFALTFHEFFHALTAYVLGDDTAKRMGRLTLNPIAHIDPLGLLFLILVKIGWAKPVQFNPQNFTHPRLYSVLVGLAGPTSNFLLALASLVAMKFLMPFKTALFAGSFYTFFEWSVFINIMLGVFNLLPIPPLDGSHIIYALLPESWKPVYNRMTLFFIILLLVVINIPAFKSAFLHAVQNTLILLRALVF